MSYSVQIVHGYIFCVVPWFGAKLCSSQLPTSSHDVLQECAWPRRTLSRIRTTATAQLPSTHHHTHTHTQGPHEQTFTVTKQTTVKVMTRSLTSRDDSTTTSIIATHNGWQLRKTPPHKPAWNTTQHSLTSPLHVQTLNCWWAGG